MRNLKHHRSRTARPKQAKAKAREEDQFNARVSALRAREEEIDLRFSHVRKVLLALEDPSSAEEPLSSFASRLKTTYSEEALSKLQNQYCERREELVREQSCLHGEALSLMESTLSLTEDKSLRSLLTGGRSEQEFLAEALSSELLLSLEEHGREFMRELRSSEDERIAKQAIIDAFWAQCSSELAAIIAVVEENKAAPDAAEVERILCGASPGCLDMAPGPELIDSISTCPDVLSRAVENARSFRDDVISEYTDLLCVDSRDVVRVSAIPGRRRIEDIRAVRQDFPADVWDKVLREVSVEARTEATGDALREYVRARSCLLDFTSRNIILPRKYRVVASAELFRKPAGDNTFMDLERLFPPFALNLPAEMHQELLKAHKGIRALIAGHRELKLGSAESELLTDIITFGFYRFGDFSPWYTFGDLHSLVRNSEVWDCEFKAFAEFFERKLMPLRGFIFRRSLEKTVHTSTPVQFYPNPLLESWNNQPFGKVTDAMENAARDGSNGTARRLFAARRLTFLLHDMALHSHLSRHFFCPLLDAAGGESTYDTERAVKIAGRPENRGYVFSVGVNNGDFLLFEAARSFCHAFDAPRTLSDDQNDLTRWASEMGLGGVAEFAISKALEYDRLFHGTKMSPIFDELRRTTDIGPVWRPFLEAFQEFHSESGAEIEAQLESVQSALTEVTKWREENEY